GAPWRSGAEFELGSRVRLNGAQIAAPAAYERTRPVIAPSSPHTVASARPIVRAVTALPTCDQNTRSGLSSACSTHASTTPKLADTGTSPTQSKDPACSPYFPP